MGERSCTIMSCCVRLWRAVLSAALAVAAGAMLVGCAGAPVQGSGQDTTQVSQQAGWFVDPFSGVRLKLPQGWSQQPSDADSLILLVRDVGPEARISLDIPELPPHIPGWIPLGMVRDGYLNYVKKIKTDVRVVEDRPMQMPGAKSRFLKLLTMSGSGQEITALVVRGDRVYILRGWGEADDTALREAFDEIAASLRWGR